MAGAQLFGDRRRVVRDPTPRRELTGGERRECECESHQLERVKELTASGPSTMNPTPIAPATPHAYRVSGVERLQPEPGRDGSVAGGAGWAGVTGRRRRARWQSDRTALHLTPYAKWVSLTLLQGARLPDPEGILTGTTAMRHVKVGTLAEVENHRDAITGLLRAAVELYGKD